MINRYNMSSIFILVKLSAITMLIVLSSYAESPTLILKNAGSNVNTMRDGELVSVLRGNVEFLYDDYTIKSDYAKWWRKKELVHLKNNVKVIKETQVLTCRKMDYNGKDKILTASGNVLFVDTKDQVEIKGKRCRFNIKTEQCFLDGDPEFVRYDTTADETLTIIGEQMIYDDSLKKTTVTKDVEITKGLLKSLCQQADYFSEDGIAQLRTDPQIFYDNHKLIGDSVDLHFVEDTLKGVSVAGNSYGLYLDETENDTTLTRIWGDSMYMIINDSGFLDSVWVYGNVLSKYSSIEDTMFANEVSGKTMVIEFAERSEIRHALVWGNAACIYYVEDESNSDRNEASGDTLSAWFADGRASRLKLLGDIRGYYYPQ